MAMALLIKQAEAERLARELSALTGEKIAEAVTRALRECLERERRARDGRPSAARRAAIDAIMERASKLPVLDDRSDEEILGYSEDGTFD